MTTGYLMVDHPNPYTPQGTYPRRGSRGKLTGTCILHTTEGAWTSGVQSLVNLVRSRSDYGCYHRACDWQDIVLLYPWEWETWQDSETNNWAVGISAACRTSDWAVMPADVREGYYRNMARMAADFVQYMAAEYGITVPLARLSGDQARAGVPGFCAHGDSGLHRSDPGADFDWTTFFDYTRQALTGIQLASIKEEIMATAKEIATAVLSTQVTRRDKNQKEDGKVAIVDVIQNYNQVNERLLGGIEKLSGQLVQVEKNLTQHFSTTHAKQNAQLRLIEKLGAQAGLSPEETKALLTEALQDSIASVTATTEIKLRTVEEAA